MRHVIEAYYGAANQLKMSRIFLSLGANLGDRRRNLQEAVACLRAAMRVTAVSPVYETAPWGDTDQPDFFNICLAAKTTQAPLELLQFLKRIETELGRKKSRRWGPRLIDIDILAYGDRVIRERNLTIPHPRMAERTFVLAPLADIAPEWVHPITGKSVAQMLTAVYRAEVHRLPEPLFDEMETGN